MFEPNWSSAYNVKICVNRNITLWELWKLKLSFRVDQPQILTSWLYNVSMFECCTLRMSYFMMIKMLGWTFNASGKYSHPVKLDMSTARRPIPQIKLFQIFILKLQGQGHGCGQRTRPYSQPSISCICFLSVSHFILVWMKFADLSQSDRSNWVL